jgi:hypothetical protein
MWNKWRNTVSQKYFTHILEEENKKEWKDGKTSSKKLSWSQNRPTSLILDGDGGGGYEADHSPPISAKDKNTQIYTSNSPYVFMM